MRERVALEQAERNSQADVLGATRPGQDQGEVEAAWKEVAYW